MKKIVLILFFYSLNFQAQTNIYNYMNTLGLNKVFRLHRIIQLSEYTYPNYTEVVKQLKADAGKDDLEYFMSESLITYKLYGKKKAYKLLEEKLKENKISDEELLFIKTWLAIFTRNLFEYENLLKELSRKYPSSFLSLRLKAVKYITYDKSFWRNKKGQKYAREIKDYMAGHSLPPFYKAYFELLILDLETRGSFNFNSEQYKTVMNTLKKYPEVEKTKQYKELTKNYFLYFQKLSDEPGKEDKKNWANYFYFLKRNPFFGKFKIFESSVYEGFSITDFPLFDSPEDTQEALKTYNKLIEIYPGMYKFYKAKTLIYDIKGEEITDKKAMATDYLLSLIKIFEINGDYGLKDLKTGIKFIYNKNTLNTYLSYLNKNDLKPIKNQLKKAIENEPGHKNLVFLQEIISAYDKTL